MAEVILMPDADEPEDSPKVLRTVDIKRLVIASKIVDGGVFRGFTTVGEILEKKYAAMPPEEAAIERAKDDKIAAEFTAKLKKAQGKVKHGTYTTDEIPAEFNKDSGGE